LLGNMGRAIVPSAPQPVVGCAATLWHSTTAVASYGPYFPGTPAPARAPAARELAERYGGRDQRATVGWALYAQAAFQDGEPVAKPDQSAAVGPGAPDAVVANLNS